MRMPDPPPARCRLAALAGAVALLMGQLARPHGATLDIVSVAKVSIDTAPGDDVMIFGSMGGEAGKSTHVCRTQMPGHLRHRTCRHTIQRQACSALSG
ncbi:MAG: hypothetical protein EA386_08515 [Rhodobacteraceae bacterium]|nr:MAG: hypothetical protein EA386_08515 [Paracoccaceae bacterium]